MEFNSIFPLRLLLCLCRSPWGLGVTVNPLPASVFSVFCNQHNWGWGSGMKGEEVGASFLPSPLPLGKCWLARSQSQEQQVPIRPAEILSPVIRTSDLGPCCWSLGQILGGPGGGTFEDRINREGDQSLLGCRGWCGGTWCFGDSFYVIFCDTEGKLQL